MSIMEDIALTKPSAARERFRAGLRTPTAGWCKGFTQANLLIVPRALAYDVLLFAQRNPAPCPVLEVTEAGSATPLTLAPQADLRTDLPAYRVYEHGVLTAEPDQIADLWRDDLVAFLTGCSLTFEWALLEVGIPVRHIEQGVNVPMFKTNISCRSAGSLRGPLVVTMRPIPARMVSRAVQITTRFPLSHGAPIHIGDPGAIGIKDISAPDFGAPVTIYPGEIPVFWACGVTFQTVVMASRPSLAITHSPGHMFISDVEDTTLAAF
jgi:uncharacterized protein YcsI (UPF0317 family)